MAQDRAPDAAAREKLAKAAHAAFDAALGDHTKASCWDGVADFILARQREREGPLLERLNEDQRAFRYHGLHYPGVAATLARHAALDAPPPRTVEQIAADVVANRKHGYEKFIAVLDELAAALARRKEQG